MRTYVIGPGGRRGVWFFSLDAARLAAVAGARATFALPYYWSRMRLEKKDSRIRYFSARRARKPVGCEIAIETGAPIEKPGDFEIFLTARFRLYAERRAQLLEAEVAHEPWRLHQARVLSWNESLFAAAGLPAAQGAPHVLYSPWIDVIVGKPHPAAIYSVAQRRHRIDARRPPRGHESRRQRDYSKKRSRARERDRIERAQPEENRVHRPRSPIPPNAPIARPMATGRIDAANTSSNTAWREAPSAIRTPISCVLCATANATVP